MEALDSDAPLQIASAMSLERDCGMSQFSGNYSELRRILKLLSLRTAVSMY